MSFVEESLITGEEVMYLAHPALTPYVWCPIAGAALAVLFLVNDSGFGWFVLLAALVVGFFAWLRYRSVEFGVTNKRVLAKWGMFGQHSLDLQLRQVEGVEVQGFRKDSYGTVVLRGTGGMRQPFPNIAKPLELRRQVQQQIAAQTP